MFIVFLNNKTLSADTFVPFALEVQKAYPDRPWEFYVFDHATRDSLQENLVLRDALKALGPVKQFTVMRGVKNTQNKLQRIGSRLRAAYLLAQFILAAYFKKTTFVHFRAINIMPLKLIAKFHPKRIMLVERAVAVTNDMEQRIDGVTAMPKAPDWVPMGHQFFYYNEEWSEMNHPEVQHKKRCQVPISYRMPAWKQFLVRYQSEFREHHKIGEDTTVITYILQTMTNQTLLADSESHMGLMRRTLMIMAEEMPGAMVLVKRHPAFIKEVYDQQEELVSRLSAELNIDIQFTTFHPQVLAQRSTFFIGNYYSNAFMPALAEGIPTIQFGVYSDLVRGVCKGQNIRPDLVTHFFDDDEAGFRTVLRGLASGSREAGLGDATAMPVGLPLAEDSPELLEPVRAMGE